MSRRDTEIACWRIWNYMQVYDESTAYSEKDLTVALGLYTELTEEALGVMQKLGVVSETDGEYKLEKYQDGPPFTAVPPSFLGES